MKPVYLLAFVVFALSSCGYNNSNPETINCSGVEISFAEDVMPVITASCATNSTCHATGSHEGPGALTTYAQVNAARNDIESSVESGDMPKNSSLSKEHRNTIICWIRNGAVNN
ncbi:MAG TPA: hypothetical protein VFE50_19805 [Cyclobacteriaceae bacterium]|nr:hypothetical protein [Cyclobacteriaceae bacterium]